MNDLFFFTATISKDDFELLCTDGSKRSVEQYEECNWGLVPSAAVVTTSAKTMKVRRIYQRFLQVLSHLKKKYRIL